MDPGRLSNVRAFVSLSLLALSIPALGHAYARAFATFRGSRVRRIVLLSWGTSAFVRWVLAPKWIVTMFIGYLLTEQALELSTTSHYGVGSLALYHAVFGFLPPDHRWLLWTNAIVSVLMLPLAAAFVARLAKNVTTGAIFAWLLALVPLFVKNDASDANQVPCLFWAFGGLVALEAWCDTGRRNSLFAAAILLSLAANARPEMPLLLALWVATFLVVLSPPLARFRDRALLVVVPLAIASVVPHLLHVGGATALLEERDSLPAMSSISSQMLRSLVRLDTVLTPSLFPVGILLFALWPTRKHLRLRLALLLLAMVTLALYGLDLCRANMARVHVPGALLVTMLAALGVTAMFRKVRRWPVRALLLLAAFATALPTVRTLWAATNEQAEEDLVREAVARLPKDAPYTFVRFARADRRVGVPGADVTHHHFPDYLFRPPRGTARLSSIVDWIDQPDLDRPAYFFLGMRCYAEFREERAPRPHGDALQPACARMQAEFELEPVFERDVPNRGDVWLEYYGDAPTLRVGLYRVRRRR